MAGYLVTSVALILSSLFAFWAIRRIRRSQTTALNGPPSPNRLFGFGIELFRVEDPASLFAKWEQEYGSVYQIPTFLGAKQVVICDPKAIAHFYSKDTYAYQQPTPTRFYIGHFFGPGVLWAEADDHKRLDTIGMAGFSHDFGALKGRTSAVSEAFGSFGDAKPDLLTMMMFIIGPVFPWMFKLPAKRNILLANLKKHTQAIADTLLEENRRSGRLMPLAIPKLVPSFKHFNILLLAGYETTAVSLTWALIELSRHQDIQESCAKSSQIHPDGSTWDQLTSGLPLSTPSCARSFASTRFGRNNPRGLVMEDDIIPLSEPIQGPDGLMIDRVFLAKGTSVRIPIEAIQRSQAFWGEDGAEFKPSRWLDNSTRVLGLRTSRPSALAYIRRWTRTCLGKMFALTEFKASLRQNSAVNTID
ncbi:cytochrome P450 [Infundibulicybe gibba]|nr:cytochrome P450 [Infundibulicybe gibba]